jgi:hypothetical protein
MRTGEKCVLWEMAEPKGDEVMEAGGFRNVELHNPVYIEY